MTIRKSIFWIHLITGIAVGLIVAVMSATGIAVAFESEIVSWIDRDIKTVSVPTNSAKQPLEQLDAAVSTQFPEFKTTSRTIPRAADHAYEYRAGRESLLYVNPYTGIAVTPKSKSASDALRLITSWHRWLGMEGAGRNTGKLITGIANLGFLFLCLSGLYMWWPRSWSANAWRPSVWFVARLKGRARNLNWHHVFGGWNVLVLIVIVVSGVVMSFSWANRLIYSLAGEEVPQRGAGLQFVSPVNVPPPSEGQQRLAREALIERITAQFPDWKAITIDSNQNPKDANTARPLNASVLTPSLFQNQGRVQLSIDPFRGDVLSKVGFEDRTPATRTRTWLRFLHTGEAFGWIGKSIAVLASLGSLFLVYTGLALSYRRFFSPRGKSLA